MFSSFDFDQIEELRWDEQDQHIDQIREDIMSENHDFGPMDLIELGLWPTPGDLTVTLIVHVIRILDHVKRCFPTSR